MKGVVSQIRNSRISIICFIFLGVFSVLVYRLYCLQILYGENIENNSELKIVKERTLKNTRGNIYDRNGNVLASNHLVYCITIEDNGNYDTTREKQLTLNSIALRIIKIVDSNKEILNNDLKITIDENGSYVFNIEGIALNRFRADVYGVAKIDEMTKEQATATANDIMEYLCSEKKIALYQENKKMYTEEELKLYGLPKVYTKNDILNIIGIRYMISLNSYQRYLPVTVATNISDETIAYILENINSLQGVDIAEDSIRIYEGDESFAHLLGYTGKISSEELSKLQPQYENYTNASIVGKSGIEQYMESSLQGTDGLEEVYVNNVGKVLDKKDTKVEPISGKDVYLSIDKDLQIAVYKILEQRIAGILVGNISSVKEFNKSKVKDASDIVIPINDVYYALLNNNIINIKHFGEPNATEVEKQVYEKFINKQKSVLDEISNQLTEKATVYKDLDKEMQVYQRYIVEELLQNKLGVLSKDDIDKKDETYIAWNQKQSISLKEYIDYAIKKRWFDISKIPSDITYIDSEQARQLVNAEIISQLQSDQGFSKKLYRYMLRDNELTGFEIC